MQDEEPAVELGPDPPVGVDVDELVANPRLVHQLVDRLVALTDRGVAVKPPEVRRPARRLPVRQ